MNRTSLASSASLTLLTTRGFLAVALLVGLTRAQAGTLAKLTIQPEKGDKIDAINLTWDSRPGAVYRVQTTTNLGNSQSWQTVEPVVADGTNAHLEVLAPPGASNSAVFYRLQAQPEIFSLEPTFVDSSDPNAALYLLGQLLPTNAIVVINGIQFTPSIIDSNGVWASVRLNGLPPGIPVTGTISVIDPGTSNVLAA